MTSGELYNEYGDINFENDSIGEDSFYGSNKKKIYKAMAKESNFLETIIKVNGINKKVRCYMAGNPGSTIINAVTGQKYRGHHIGKYDEDMYFKVMLCSGENGQNSATLFYDTPIQYEKHFYRELSQKTKDDWFEKYEYQQKIEERKQKKLLL